MKSHEIRAKPLFNPEKMRQKLAGSLKLNDDWEYIPGENDKDVSQKEIKRMKRFFRTYLVLFCAVWDGSLAESVLEEYLEGSISFRNLIQEFDFYEDHPDMINIQSIDELEDYCVDNDLIDIRDN